jgi:uncharacterized protein YecE (DUF72 family)
VTVLVGTSGWVYPEWRGRFYPEGLRQADTLEYAADRFSTIEVNGSFYGSVRPAAYRGWAARVPAGFTFAVKGPRLVTHVTRLHDVAAPMADFLASGPLALGDRLGPLLWQFPPSLSFDATRLRAFLALLPRSTAEAARPDAGPDDQLPLDGMAPAPEPDRPLRHAVEVRHPSLVAPEALAVFREAGVAVVAADTAGRFPYVDQPADDLAYVRLHGSRELYRGAYTDAELAGWARRVERWAEGGREVRVYFDNTADGAAPVDAERLATLLGVGPDGVSGTARPAPRP